MYQQGYRPEPPQKKRSAVPGSQAGYAPERQQAQQQMPRQQAYYYQQQPKQVQKNNQGPVQNGYTPQYQQAPNRRSGKKPPQRKSGFSMAKLLVALVLIAGLCGGGYYYYIASQVTPYDTTFCHGVYIDGINMGGLTAQEGIDMVYAHAQTRQNSWSVTLMYDGQTVHTFTSSELGMEIKVNEILEQAWALGRQGNVFERKTAQDALKKSPKEFYTVVPNANTSAVDVVLQNIRNDAYKKAEDAKIVGFDPVAEAPFTYQQEVIGRQLDTQPLKEKIYEMVSKMETGELQVEPMPIYPSVTVADLQAQTTLRTEVTTEIDRKSAPNRTQNIRIACDRINGRILKADEKFSFNGIVGVRDSKNFLEAIEYVYGEQTMGYGGGVCQVSTTIYQAALLADLEIVKRTYHSDSVSYAEYGQDATVSSEKGHEKDFVFKNTSGGTLYVCAAVQTNNKNRSIVRVRIYGPSLNGVSYKLESKTIEVLQIPAGVEEVKDKDQSHVTYTDQTAPKSDGKKGCVVETYLCRIESNVIVDRKLVSTDTYKAKPKSVWIGTQKR